MFGLRPDGKKLKTLDPLSKIIPHIMSARHDSQNLSKLEIECESIDNYIASEAEKGYNMTYMDVIIASVIRAVALRPRLNRFVMNGRVFKRNHIAVSFVVKKSLRDDADETTIKLKFTGKESIYQIKEKIDESIEANTHVTAVNGTDKTVKIFTIVPNILIKFLVGTIKFLDRHGLIPNKLLDVSPFHTTFFITNLKSIKTDYIYHHLYDFGNTGFFISMGKEHYEPVVNNNKELEVKKIMRLGFVMDERYCDGFYFANSFRYLKRIIGNLNVLNEPLEKIVEDIR